MSSINGVNGAPVAASRGLLTGVLRGDWGFEGFVVRSPASLSSAPCQFPRSRISDCDTISSIATAYGYTANVVEAAAAALEAGGDINCGPEYALLERAMRTGLVSNTTLDRALRRALRSRVLTGDFDPSAHDPYANITMASVDSAAHREIATQISRESAVLLKRGPGFPLMELDGKVRCCTSALSVARDCADAPAMCAAPPAKLPSLSLARLFAASVRPAQVLAVVGPSAADASVQAHTYHGTPSEWLTTLGALRALVDPSTSIITAAGCDRHGTDRSGFGAALAAASRADAVVFVGGLDEHDEEEDTDRADFRLPGVQAALIEALAQ
eukprot:2700029-Prymnesium_polylepis.1